MFKCIRCLNEFDDAAKSEEHVFPESIGGTICIYDICKPCNSLFGSKVDGPFINNWLIDSRRMLLGLAGKSGYVPNPLENGVMANDPTQKVKYIIEDGVPKGLYTIPSVEHGIDANGNPTISIKLDKSDEAKLPEIMETIKARLAKDGKKIDIKTINRKDVRIEKPWVHQQFKIDIWGWQRGIIKIAYELAYRFLGTSYLDDPVARNLRDILVLDDIDEDTFKQHPVRGTIELAANKQDFAFLDDPNSLYGALLHINGILICVVKIFDVFQGKIVVTESFAGKFPLEGNVIRIDVAKNETIELPYYDYLANMFPDDLQNGA
jgi:hypothetical protein